MNFPERNKLDNKKIIKLDERKYIHWSGHKPAGFWYSCGDSWYDWVIRNGIFYAKYMHKITMRENSFASIREKDVNCILLIANNIDFDIFCKTYKIQNNDIFCLIDWKKVAQDYGGIEISPYRGKTPLSSIWYHSWDVASGCVWNLKIIHNIENIKKMPKLKFCVLQQSHQ